MNSFFLGLGHQSFPTNMLAVFLLSQYVLEELNIRSLVPCNDTLKYASLRAEPDFRYENCIHEDCFESFFLFFGWGGG